MKPFENANRHVADQREGGQVSGSEGQKRIAAIEKAFHESTA